ncbi:hypothetical protein IW150_002392, partial [Coemansia sp. RSA 2607]
AAERARLLEQASLVLALTSHAHRPPLPDPSAVQQHVHQQARRLRQERIITEDVRAMLAAARARAARQLTELMDIEIGVTADGWRICGMRVAGCPAEEAAAALGVAARCVLVAGVLVAAPLRYAVLTRGARAAVCGVQGELWPLFAARGARELQRMAVAVRLLGVDVAQLLVRLGVQPVPAAAPADVLAALTLLLLAIETSSFAQ